jgi:hypothetical protein
MGRKQFIVCVRACVCVRLDHPRSVHERPSIVVATHVRYIYVCILCNSSQIVSVNEDRGILKLLLRRGPSLTAETFDRYTNQVRLIYIYIVYSCFILFCVFRFYRNHYLA